MGHLIKVSEARSILLLTQDLIMMNRGQGTIRKYLFFGEFVEIKNGNVNTFIIKAGIGRVCVCVNN